MEQLYVSASRAKEWIRLYTDDKAEIRDAVKRSSQKLAALDVKRPVRQAAPQPAKPQRWHRLRKHMDRMRRLAVIDRTRAAWEKQPRKQKERQADHGYSR